MKSKMLGTLGYERLLRCSSSSECATILSEQGYLDSVTIPSGGLDPNSWQALFETKTVALIHKLARLSPQDCAQLLTAYENRYRLESLKSGLRLMAANVERDGSSGITTPELTTDFVRGIVETRNLERLAQVTGASAIYGEISSVVSEGRPLALVEGIVDKHGLALLWRATDMSDMIDRQSVQPLVGEQIDTLNLLLVARSKALGIAEDEIRRILAPVNYRLGDALSEATSSGSTTNALRAFTKTIYASSVGQFLETYKEGDSLHPLDSSLRRWHAARCLAAFSGFPFCAGLPLAFTYLMGYEVSDLQSIILGKENGLSADAIEQFLILWKTL